MDRITDLRVRLSSALQKIADAKRASSETAIKLYEEAEANFLQLGDEERAFRASSLRISTLCKNRPSSYLEHAETVDGFLTTYGTFGETPEYLRHKKTYLNALKAMHHAAAAYRSERDVLTQFLESFSHPDRRKAAGLAEEDLVIARCQVKALEARVKRARGDSLLSIAQSYHEAALASVPPPRRLHFRVHSNITAQHHNFLSSYHKFCAFSHLTSGAQAWETVIAEINFAYDHAKIASRHCSAEDRKSFYGNIRYTSYWLHVFKLRYESLKASPNIVAALQFRALAQADAEYFEPNHSLFPNRFYTIEDLRNEFHFIEAFGFLLDQKIDLCLSALKTWLAVRG